MMGAMVGVLTLVACGDSGDDGQSALLATTVETAGANCTSGGTRIDAGLDANADGTLQAGEVTQTRFVCDGTAGGSGPAGSNGTTGSNGTNGLAALLRLSVEAPGANCLGGGTRVDAGADGNGNGTLDNTEISATSYVCSAADTVWTTVSTASYPMLSNRRYLADRGTLATLTLPLAPAVGDTVAVTGGGAGGWQLAQNAGQAIVVGDDYSGIVRAVQPTVTMTAAAPQSWNPIAANTSGSIVYAASTLGIRISIDSGANWTTSLATAASWSGIATTPDGQIAVAVAANGTMQRTVDQGVSWAPMTPIGAGVERVGMSSDGQVILAARDFSGGAVHLSIDGGTTFSTVPGLPAGGNWISAEVSDDGQKMVASQNGTVINGRTVLSTDGGTTWTTLTTPLGMHEVALSADGTTLVGITHRNSGSDNTVYVSKDDGVTWTARLTLPLSGAGNLLRVDVSGDGKTMLANTWTGNSWVSFNGGTNWGSNNRNGLWYGAAVSRDGTRIFLGDQDAAGRIYAATRSTGNRSTAGTTGYLAGAQYTGASLQYVGNGTWLLTGSTGTVHIR